MMKRVVLMAFALLGTMAWNCTDSWNPSAAYRGLEPKPLNLCSGVECTRDIECDSNTCSDAPSMIEIENWVASGYKDNLKMGTCSIPGDMIAFAILGGVCVLFGVAIYCYCCFRRRSLKQKLEKAEDGQGLQVSFSSN